MVSFLVSRPVLRDPMLDYCSADLDALDVPIIRVLGEVKVAVSVHLEWGGLPLVPDATPSQMARIPSRAYQLVAFRAHRHVDGFCMPK